MSTPSGPLRGWKLPGRTRRDRPADPVPWPLVALVAVFFAWLYVPIIVVVVYSFNSLNSLQSFGGFSLRWYEEFLNDTAMMSSLGNSVQVAAIAMVCSVLLGLLASFGVARARTRFTRLSVFVLLIPLATPEIVSGVSFLLFYRQLDLQLSLLTVAVAHVTFFVAYANMVIQARVSTLNGNVEDAARDLGASPFQAWRLVSLPLVRPALFSAGVLVFALSFDNFVLSFFNSGVHSQTLPVGIYSSIRFGITPTVNAAGSLMMLVSIALTLVALLVARRLLQSSVGRATQPLDTGRS